MACERISSSSVESAPVEAIFLYFLNTDSRLTSGILYRGSNVYLYYQRQTYMPAKKTLKHTMLAKYMAKPVNTSQVPSLTVV